ncbi:hypothetical protein ABZ461_39215, partial [Actinacidiphila glaucinigra]|uniref:hypothetical protein n=1 Tax=Actinacidiphila glaucinigra TaxID=235986 RepID=UPI0033EE2C0E
MSGTTSPGRLLPRLAYGRALLGALTAHRLDRPRAEPMTSLCGLDRSGFLHRCRSAGGLGAAEEGFDEGGDVSAVGFGELLDAGDEGGDLGV